MQPVAILFHRIGPYHRVRLNSASCRFPTVAIELTSTDRIYAWDPVVSPELERITLFQEQAPNDVPRGALTRRIKHVLDTVKPRAIVIPGWSEPSALAALRWAAANGTPAVVMSDSQEADAVRWPWKESLKRRLLTLFSSALVGGSPHVAYLKSLGMPADRIFDGYDVVDNEHFARGADLARSSSDAERRRLNLPQKFFLASCRFVEKKNLPVLLTAFARFRELQPNNEWKLVLLGDGPLKPKILATADKLQLGTRLVLPGFQQYDELPAYYGLASVFVHASKVEQWGLVVNEAMAAGLPVLVSNRCGCAPDLVQEGINGHTFDPGHAEALGRLMLRMASSDSYRANAGEASRRIIKDWSTDRFGAGLENALGCAATERRPSLIDTTLLRLLIQRTAAPVG